MKQNRADIKRESPKDHPFEQNARHQIELAAHSFTPIDFEHQASAVIHYYRKPNSAEFAFITQLVDLHTIEEGQADIGWKELQKAMMKAYGRKDGRRTDTTQEII